MRGVLDRIEDGGKAVIILEEERREIILPVSRLPRGSRVNSWFTIDGESGELEISLDEETNRNKEQQADALTRKLRAENFSSRFKRK